MNGPEHESSHQPDPSTPKSNTGGEFEAGDGVDDGAEVKVRARLSRRPHARRRRFPLVTRMRLKNLTAPLDTPGTELAEVPGIGVFVIAIMAIVALFVVGVLLGGFLIAFIELVLLGLLALVGSVWAWMRGHPTAVVIDVDDHRWMRADGPSRSLAEDAQAVADGADPAALGYERMDRDIQRS